MKAKPQYVCRSCFYRQGVKMAACLACNATDIAYVRSTAEARRWDELRLLERAGEISELVTQPVYPLEVNGEPVGRYTADFRYRNSTTGKLVVEDKKGVDTQSSRLRRKMAEAQYGITVVLT